MKPRFLVALALALVTMPMLLAPASRAADDAATELSARYSPVVVIREQVNPCGAGEPYLPTSVEAVLGNSDVTLRGPSGESISAPGADDLRGKAEGWYLDLPGEPLAPGCDYETWFHQSSADRPASVYAHVTTDPDHPGMLALQYWFFWVFNDWNDKHEGDWEMIQLLFPADSAGAALATEPVSVAFAQHEGSETADWSDPRLTRIDDHVIVYPSQGSHAAYTTQAEWFGKSAAAGFGCDNTLAQGKEIRPEIITLPENSADDPGWLDFTGRWGEKAPSYNNGPTGPNTKMQWLHPVTWQIEKGRAGAVSLPIVGGPAVDSFCGLTSAGSLLFVDALGHPFLTLIPIVLLLLLIVLAARGTRWRQQGSRTIDRERRSGQVATASFALLFRRFRAFWPPILVVGLTVAGGLALQRLTLRRRQSGDITDVNGLAHLGLSAAVAVVIGFALAPVISVALAATSRVADNLAGGRAARPWQAMGISIRHPAAALAQLIVYLIVTLLASSLFLLPVALLLISWWSVSMPSAAIEGRGLLAALRRSAQLTKGRRWRTVLLSALLIWIGFILPGALGGILLLVTGWPFWATNVVAILLSAVLLPFSAIGLTLQFYDFRQEETRDSAGKAENAQGV